MQYDYSKRALYHPEERPVFVGFSPNLSFEDDNRRFSLINAWWLSNASHLAYYDEEKIKHELQKVELQLVEYFDIESTQGFLAKGANLALLAFRGTQVEDNKNWNPKDRQTNLNLKLVPFDTIARVHRGFLQALNEVWHRLDAKLRELDKQGVRIWYTGHSLGAALATLAAARRKPTALFTYGSPMVGDKKFATLVEEIPIYRFVNCTDIVSILPSAVFGYHHVGKQYFITSEGRIIKDPTKWQVIYQKAYGRIRYIANLPWFRKGILGLRSLADHSIINYTTGIWNEYEKTE